MPDEPTSSWFWAVFGDVPTSRLLKGLIAWVIIVVCFGTQVDLGTEQNPGWVTGGTALASGVVGILVMRRPLGALAALVALPTAFLGATWLIGLVMAPLFLMDLPPRPTTEPVAEPRSLWDLVEGRSAPRILTHLLLILACFAAATKAGASFEQYWRIAVLAVLLGGIAGALLFRPPALGAISIGTGVLTTMALAAVLDLPEELMFVPGVFVSWAIADSLRLPESKREPTDF